jgi:hypothetical protein
MEKSPKMCIFWFWQQGFASQVRTEPLMGHEKGGTKAIPRRRK